MLVVEYMLQILQLAVASVVVAIVAVAVGVAVCYGLATNECFI